LELAKQLQRRNLACPELLDSLALGPLCANIVGDAAVAVATAISLQQPATDKDLTRIMELHHVVTIANEIAQKRLADLPSMDIFQAWRNLYLECCSAKLDTRHIESYFDSLSSALQETVRRLDVAYALQMPTPRYKHIASPAIPSYGREMTLATSRIVCTLALQYISDLSRCKKEACENSEKMEQLTSSLSFDMNFDWDAVPFHTDAVLASENNGVNKEVQK